MREDFEQNEADYRVSLEMFSGPLDLLLSLIKRAEVDIYDIPVAIVAEQYSEYVADIENLDIENASEFLVLAAKLLEIKSALVLPRNTEDEEDDDPRLELVQKLLEYKKYRDLGVQLGEIMDFELLKYGRPDGLLINESPQELNLEELDKWDLFQNFSELIDQVSLDFQKIVYDDVPIEDLMQKLLEIVKTAGGRVEFATCIAQIKDRIQCIGMFLALLELMKNKEIIAEQDKMGQIYLSLVNIN